LCKALYLIQILQKEHSLKDNAIKTIQSVLIESSMVSTFSDLGLPVKFAFWEELKFRIYTRLFKYPPNRHHFLDLLRLCLSDKKDALWIKALDHASFQQLFAVLGDDFHRVYQQIMTQQVVDSLRILTIRLSSQGLMSVIAQLQDGSAKQNPFAGVVSAFEALRQTYDKHGSDVSHPDFLAQMNYFRLTLSLCEREIDAIHNVFDERGVSVEVIFYLNSMLRYIDRIRLLLNVWLSPSFDSAYPLWIQLVVTHARSMSVKRLFAYNYRLLAQQINERSAQTGEHYIT
jgi:site-specific recombinase